MVPTKCVTPEVIWRLRQVVCEYALCRFSEQYHRHFYYYSSNARVRGFKKFYMHHMDTTDAAFVLHQILFLMYFLI